MRKNMVFSFIAAVCLSFLLFFFTSAKTPLRMDYSPLLTKDDLPSGYKFIMSTKYDNFVNLSRYMKDRKLKKKVSTENVKKLVESWATMSARKSREMKKKNGKWPEAAGVKLERYYFASQSDALAFWKYYLYPLFCNRPAKFPVPIREGSFSGNYLGDYCWVKEAPSDQVREEWEEISPGYFRNHRTIIFIKGNVLVRIDASRTPHNASGEVDPLFAEKIARIVESRL